MNIDKIINNAKGKGRSTNSEQYVTISCKIKKSEMDAIKKFCSDIKSAPSTLVRSFVSDLLQSIAKDGYVSEYVKYKNKGGKVK
ncbi:hypothetical protein FACS189459_2490 [Bacilli bacterium]|nr:hypothetical protein FACS189459_2490 [Bacilli bacterium]